MARRRIQGEQARTIKQKAKKVVSLHSHFLAFKRQICASYRVLSFANSTEVAPPSAPFSVWAGPLAFVQPRTVNLQGSSII